MLIYFYFIYKYLTEFCIFVNYKYSVSTSNIFADSNYQVTKSCMQVLIIKIHVVTFNKDKAFFVISSYIWIILWENFTSLLSFVIPGFY